MMNSYSSHLEDGQRDVNIVVIRDVVAIDRDYQGVNTTYLRRKGIPNEESICQSSWA
jgi:hypothetical protein